MARVVHPRLALTAALVATVGVVWLAPRAGERLRPTDFNRDVRQMDADIAALAGDRTGSSVALAYRLYQRAALTERPDDYRDVRGALAAARARDGRAPDLCLLEAMLSLRFHELDAARNALDDAPELAGSAEAQALAADLDLQRGHYDAAQQGYEAAIREEPAWPAFARLAFLTARRGDVIAADALYVRAEDELTAKEMRAYAWLELQRGQLQFGRGRYDEAMAHYRLAARAYTGYWLVDEYTAELLGAERRFDEAIATYERAIARAPRPDLLQQLGDLYAFMGRPHDAQQWHKQALDGYLESQKRGEVQFLHHLAGFYADVMQDGDAAVKWARADAALRPGYATDDALAWALYRRGDLSNAVAALDRALSSGIVDAHMYSHAAAIKTDAGDREGGRRWTRAATAINPRYADFHAHR